MRLLPRVDRHGESGEVQLAEVKCHTAKPKEACYNDVTFVKSKFLKEHPDWYRGLTQDSSFEEIQAYFSTQKDSKGRPRCPWPCDYSPSTTPASPEEKRGSCHDARAGEDCWAHIKYTSKNVIDHPDWFGGLTAESSFTDIQAYLHEQNKEQCPRPCSRARDEEPDEKLEKNCQTAVEGEACWDAVQWVRTSGYIKHPEWFKGITANSTPEEVQNYLAGRNGSHCSRRACHCHTALPGDDCYTHVAFTMKAIPDHPAWYPGLTTKSTPKEVQAFMHEERDGHGKRVCPMPCGLNHDKKDKHHRCHTAIPGETCFDQVLWAMDEVEGHPEWYPGLNSSSSHAEFQALLHLGKKDSQGKRCPIPCDEEAMDKARNNSEMLNCHTAQQDEPCYHRVVEVHKDIVKHPEKYHNISAHATFEEVQAYVHDLAGSHCDHMPCYCHTAVEGEKCYKSVSWVLSTGIELHRNRFSMLSANSTREEAQLTLHASRRHHCLLPCTAPWSRLLE